MKLIYIHGINNEDNTKESIVRDWTAAINEGLRSIGKVLPENISYEAAYYGKLLKEEANSWDKNEKTEIDVMGSNDPFSEYVTQEGDLYKEYKKAYGLTNDEITLSLDAGESAPTTEMMAKGIHKKWLKAIARALEKKLPTRGKYVARIFLRQAAAYLHKSYLKKKIDDRVFDEVFSVISEDDDVCIIAHSLGTIIAYTLLRQTTDTVKANALFTMGSPLGIEIVKNELGNPKICLPNVKKWINFSDKEDFVALKPELNSETFWCDEIKNHSFIDNGFENAHSITMYLSQPAFAKELAVILDI